MDRRPQNRTLFRRPPCGLAGATAPTTRCACHRSAGDHSPRPVPAPHRPSRAPAFPALAGQALTESRSLTGGQTRVAFPGPARRGVLQDDRSLWQGPSPLPQRHAAPWPAGGQSPRPAPDPPPAGASPPPGRALAFRGAWTDRSTGHRPARAGKRNAFPVPARTGESTVPASMAGAIAPATLLHWHLDRLGAKAPGQRPTRPWRALLARRVGRWPSVVPGLAGLQGTVPRGRGKRGARFLFPPALTKALSPLLSQGPSPLPQRCAGIRTGRGPKPPASARPAHGGRFAPPGAGAGLCWSRTDGSTGHRAARAGETPCVS